MLKTGVAWQVPPRRQWLQDGQEAYIAEGDADTLLVSARIPLVAEPQASARNLLSK